MIFDTTQALLNELTLYIDASLSSYYYASAGSENTSNFANATLYLMSSDGTGGYLAGKLDDVRVYTRALTKAEITSLYVLGK